MVIQRRNVVQHIWLLLALCVLISNLLLYHTSFGTSLLPSDSSGVVLGSLIDLAIVLPLLFLAWMKKWHYMSIIATMAAGLMLARFIIPMHYLEPYETITWVGFAVEGVFIIVELCLIIGFVKYVPQIIQAIKESSLPTLFAYEMVINQYTKQFIFKIISTELFIFYYAFFCWKKPLRVEAHQFTLYRNSNIIAFYIMIIHALILETIAIHWWLHNQWPLLSLVLLALNIYSAIFFIADLQALRHNPLHLNHKGLYISLGFMKKTHINWSNVKEIISDSEVLQQKRSKDTLEFIARDFEDVYPDIIIVVKEPIIKKGIFKPKMYRKVAIKVDEPQSFKSALYQYKMI